MAAPKTVDEYIASAPAPAQEKLRQMREIIKELAPDAQEKMSYGMPYYSLNGRLVYLGYFKDHVSLFAMPAANKKFEKEIQSYHHSKATVGFSYDKPLPVGLIRKMVKFRVEEQRTKAK
ncbi:DUF1801 domain-containing protein [Candidatus Saccharibacteria bacterium]|nr:DUF1801 domain-containing protein [Candidatus Saccharibacteria bacterium]